MTDNHITPESGPAVKPYILGNGDPFNPFDIFGPWYLLGFVGLGRECVYIKPEDRTALRRAEVMLATMGRAARQRQALGLQVSSVCMNVPQRVCA
jgi:hypothetical protein